jgi:hypothetical protein
MAGEDGAGLSIGELKEALHALTDLGGAWGRNMDVGKKVLVRVHGHLFELDSVSAGFDNGMFVAVLDASTPVTPL